MLGLAHNAGDDFLRSKTAPSQHFIDGSRHPTMTAKGVDFGLVGSGFDIHNSSINVRHTDLQYCYNF